MVMFKVSICIVSFFSPDKWQRCKEWVKWRLKSGEKCSDGWEKRRRNGWSVCEESKREGGEWRWWVGGVVDCFSYFRRGPSDRSPYRTTGGCVSPQSQGRVGGLPTNHPCQQLFISISSLPLTPSLFCSSSFFLPNGFKSWSRSNLSRNICTKMVPIHLWCSEEHQPWK